MVNSKERIWLKGFQPLHPLLLGFHFSDHLFVSVPLFWADGDLLGKWSIKEIVVLF